MSIFVSKKKPEKFIPENLFPCRTGKIIIEAHVAELTNEIRSLISAPAELYNKLYLATLYNVAEFCQAMPESELDELYSLLANQMKLCITALKIRRGLLLPKDADSETIAQQEPQWVYAVFSAAILCQLNRIIDRRISLHNRQGAKIADWNPIIGNLNEPDIFFKIQWDTHEMISPETFMAAIAVNIVPAAAIKWISQNRLLFDQWWKSITKNENNLLGNIINKAANEIKFRKAASIRDYIPINSSLNDAPTEVDNTEFITDNSLVINELLILIDSDENYINGEPAWLRIKGGLFINRNLLEKFIVSGKFEKDIPDFINFNKNLLISENEHYLFRYRPKAFEDRHRVEGIIFNEKILNDKWRNQPINTEFLPDIKL